MPKTLKLSKKDEEKLINFVKSNEILYNVKHKMFRDTEAKKRLWLKIAKELNVDVEIVKKKWVAMRDYFIHSRGKKPLGSVASVSSTKRDAALSFLLEKSVMKTPTISSLPSIIEQETLDIKIEDGTADDVLNEASEINSSKSFCQEVFSSGSMSDTTSGKTFHRTENNEILREFLPQQPKPSDYIPQNFDDVVQKFDYGVQKFFDSMASTVRTLSPSAIARIKMKVAQIVGEEELVWAEQNAARRLQ